MMLPSSGVTDMIFSVPELGEAELRVLAQIEELKRSLRY
jgi:hypothetical protein